MSTPIHRHHGPVHHIQLAPATTKPSTFVSDPAKDVLSKSTQDPPENPLLASLLHGTITVGSFTDRVQIAKAKSKQKLYDDNVQISQAHKDLIQGQASAATALQLAQKTIGDIANQTVALANTINQQLQALKAKADAYTDPATATSADSSAITSLLATTAEYLSGDISSTAYILAVNVYNGYATSRDTAISTAIQNYNSQVAALHAELTSDAVAAHSIDDASATFNIPPLASQNPPVDPSGITVTTFTGDSDLLPIITLPDLPADVPDATPEPPSHPPFVPPNVDPDTLPSGQTVKIKDLDTHIDTPDEIQVPDTSAFVQTFFQPLFNAIFPNLQLTNQTIDNVIASDDYRRTFNIPPGGKHIDLPSAVVDRHYVKTQGSPGVFGSLLISKSATPEVERKISKSVFSAFQNETNLTNVQATLGALNKFILLTIKHAGLTALPPGMRALKLENLSPENAFFSFQVIGGVSIAKQLTQFINSGATEEAVHNIVQNQLGNQVDVQTRDAIARALTAQVNITLLQTAANSAAISLQAPGLATHLTGNVNGLPGSATAPLSPSQVLNDSNRLQFLTATLARSGLATSEQISSAIHAALAKGDINKETLAAQFTQAGIKEAQQLADQAETILRLEERGTRIFHTELQNRTANVTRLTEELKGVSNASEVSNQAINAVLQNKTIGNDAEFQAALQLQLVSQGINASLAAKSASNLVNAVTAATAPLSPLTNPEPEVLSLNQLRAHLIQHASDLLANPLGTQEGRRHADRIAEILIGAPGDSSSLLGLLNKNVNDLLKATDKRVAQALQQNFREFLSPNIDAFIFHNKIIDPANTFLLTAMSSTRLTGAQQPKNYIKYLDFYV